MLLIYFAFSVKSHHSRLINETERAATAAVTTPTNKHAKSNAVSLSSARTPEVFSFHTQLTEQFHSEILLRFSQSRSDMLFSSNMSSACLFTVHTALLVSLTCLHLSPTHLMISNQSHTLNISKSKVGRTTSIRSPTRVCRGRRNAALPPPSPAFYLTKLFMCSDTSSCPACSVRDIWWTSQTHTFMPRSSIKTAARTHTHTRSSTLTFWRVFLRDFIVVSVGVVDLDIILPVRPDQTHTH